MTTLLAAALATLVFCAPGYPGGAGDAQPLVNDFAAAAAAAAGWPAGSLAAVYDPTEEGGLQKLSSADAVLAFVPYPFFVEHAAQLHLTPLVQADVADTGVQQRWTLIAKAGRITAPASMAGFTILSTAGYAPDFVRHSALETWALPADVKIEPTGQVLSALRRVAAGEPIAVLLDQTQFSHASLPPRERGTTWSMLPSSGRSKAPVYWQRLPSRSRIVRAQSFGRFLGTRAKFASTITVGTRIAPRGVRTD